MTVNEPEGLVDNILREDKRKERKKMDEEGRKRRKERESVKRWRVLLDGVLQGNDNICGEILLNRKRRKRKKKRIPRSPAFLKLSVS